MTGNRTGLDFSKHEVTVTQQEGLLVHYLARPKSRQDAVKFINTNDILAVTGDYGNWIFCREFHPSPTGGVSDGYWLEKLTYASCQEPKEYDWEETAEAINEQLNGGLVEYGYKGDKLDEMKEYYERCLTYVEDEFEYINEARNIPSFADHESAMIVRKKLNVWLPYVFDAFEEICRRMKEEQNLLSEQPASI